MARSGLLDDRSGTGAQRTRRCFNPTNLRLNESWRSVMNVQEARFRDLATNETNKAHFVDTDPSLIQRAASVAAVAAAEADDVDRAARFPKAAIDSARQQKLLGIQIPRKFG